MMKTQLLELAAELARRGEPFALATVVRREAYSSAQVGDRAIITADGGYHGWLGGTCTRPTVQREAARAIADGQPRLVAIAPEAASGDALTLGAGEAPPPSSRLGITVVPMTCHSGGTVEIFIEPVAAPPPLLVWGDSPVAAAVVRIGRAMGHRVELASEPRSDPDPRPIPPSSEPLAAAPRPLGAPAAVIATMGARDEDALAEALALGPAYVGVVASRRRFALVREALIARGVSPAALAAVRSPAGLDLGGRRPEEVAIAILAEIIAARAAARSADVGPVAAAAPPPSDAAAPPPAAAAAPRAAAAPAPPAPGGPAPAPAPAPGEDAPAEAIDPVCHMKVVVARARHVGEHAGRRWYFCCPRCKDRFLADPQRYLARAGADG
jgi:xanthine dehydrogenase accessory factor